MRSTRHSSSRGEWESTESQPAGDGDAWLPALVPEQLPQHAEEQHLSQVLNATGHDSIEQPGGLISEVPEPAVDTSAAAGYQSPVTAQMTSYLKGTIKDPFAAARQAAYVALASSRPPRLM